MGKTAVATRIVRRHGLRWYGADTRTWQHRDRALLARNAAARRWEAMTPQERWVQSTPAEMFDMSLHGERGPMVLDDLRALPDSPLLVADGSTLPAQAVSSGIADRSRAVWLLPTDDFQRALLAARGTPPGPTALYLLLRDRIASGTSEHGAPTLILDGSLDLEATVAAVEELFAAALEPQPAVYKIAAHRLRRAGACGPGSSGPVRRPASALLWGRVAPGGMTVRMTAASPTDQGSSGKR
jgi:hypothetical protein